MGPRGSVSALGPTPAVQIGDLLRRGVLPSNLPDHTVTGTKTNPSITMATTGSDLSQNSVSDAARLEKNRGAGNRLLRCVPARRGAATEALRWAVRLQCPKGRGGRVWRDVTHSALRSEMPSKRH